MELKNIDRKQILIFLIIVTVVLSVISVVKRRNGGNNDKIEITNDDIETEQWIEDYETIVYEAIVDEATADETMVDETMVNETETSIFETMEYYEDKAEASANADDEEGMLKALGELSDKLPGDELEQLKRADYTKLVLAHIVNMDLSGSSAKDIRDYLDGRLYDTGNNCRVMEFWDYYDNMYHKSIGEMRMQASDIRNVNGYVIENSAYEILDYSDLEGLSEYELYFGLYEIYARYGRIFTDTAVSDYFNGTDWYNPSIIPNNFDERVLGEVERQNINTILQYCREMGYRS